MKNIEGKYLTFSLKNEIYGIPISSVKEINAMMNITEVPNTPKYVKGVINLRGKIISIMDLRLRLGMPEQDYSERTCIVVVETMTATNIKKKIGVVVDNVAEVIDIKSSELEDFEEDLKDDLEAFINGIAKVKDKIIIILDIISVVSKVEINN